MSVAIVLPARLKSTRLPNKLLLSRTGKTLLEHTIDRAKLAQAKYPKLFTNIRVACDDESLIAAARKTGVDAVMTDPNHQSGTDRIAEAAKDLKEEIIVNLQADEPEINPENLARVASLLLEAGARKDVMMSTLAVPIYLTIDFIKPSNVKVVCDNCGRALYFSRAPIPVDRDGPAFQVKRDANTPALGLHHIGIYGYRRVFLSEFGKLPPSKLEQLEKLEQLRVLEAGYGIQVGVVDAHTAGIDTPEDYEAFVTRWNSQEAKTKSQEPGAKS